MKKWIALLLAAVLAFSLAACGMTMEERMELERRKREREWTESTETDNPEETSDHDSKDGSADKPAEEHVHDWGEWVVTQTPGCETPGEEQRVCKLDNSHRETQTLAPLGHSWVSRGGVVPACERCGSPEPTALASIRVGDTVAFGNYEQDRNTANGREPIAWTVLAVEGSNALLITSYAIEERPFNSPKEDVTWATSSLRSWLNNGFIAEAFSASEQNALVTTRVHTEDNPNYKAPATQDQGPDTEDRVFILSVQEALNYFPDNASRRALATAYTKSRGNTYVDPDNGCSWWWLRTKGIKECTATNVNPGGDVNDETARVESDYGTVRPVIWVDLTLAALTPASPVTIDPPKTTTGWPSVSTAQEKVIYNDEWYTEIAANVNSYTCVRYSDTYTGYWDGTDLKLIAMSEKQSQTLTSHYYFYYHEGKAFMIILDYYNSQPDQIKLFYWNGEMYRWREGQGNIYLSNNTSYAGWYETAQQAYQYVKTHG